MYNHLAENAKNWVRNLAFCAQNVLLALLFLQCACAAASKVAETANIINKNSRYNFLFILCDAVVNYKDGESSFFTGLLQSFQTPKKCHLWLISKCEKNCNKYQILIGIIPTFSENFIQINQVAIRPFILHLDF